MANPLESTAATTTVVFDRGTDVTPEPTQTESVETPIPDEMDYSQESYEFEPMDVRSRSFVKQNSRGGGHVAIPNFIDMQFRAFNSSAES